MTRVCIVILGMHRSGTSALAGTLGLLGATMPEHQIAANPTNPTGHWEPERLVRINDRLLEEAGSGWQDWRRFDPGAVPSERMRAYRDEIVSCLEEEYAEATLFVLKDPRISRMVPLYSDILGSMGVDPKYVLCLRNPVDVAESLDRRNAMSAGFAALLWLRHVLEAERSTRDRPRVLLTYEALLDDWRSVAERIAGTLEFHWPRTIQDAAPEIEPFLQRDLEHHDRRSVDLDASEKIERWVRDAYGALQSLVADDDDREAAARLDAVSAAFEPAAVTFGSATFPDLAERDRQLAVMAAQLRRETRRREKLEKTLDGIYGSRSWRMTGPIRHAGTKIHGGRPAVRRPPD